MSELNDWEAQTEIKVSCGGQFFLHYFQAFNLVQSRNICYLPDGADASMKQTSRLYTNFSQGV